jgi:uncharacterized protein YyaL (SSP411 family)
MGRKAVEFQHEFDREYLPLALFDGSEKEENLPLLENRFVEGQTRIYVCKNRTCNLPVNEVSEAIKQLRE